ncbi:hypothetical protein [Streptomyces flaveolus]
MASGIAGPKGADLGAALADDGQSFTPHLVAVASGAGVQLGSQRG